MTKLNSRCRQQIADMYELKKHLKIEYSIQFIYYWNLFWNLHLEFGDFQDFLSEVVFVVFLRVATVRV